MSEETPKRRLLRKPGKVESLRAKRQTASVEADKPSKARKIRAAASRIKRPVHAARRVGRKEYYLPMPDNRIGRFLNKRRQFRWAPKFVREAWAEVRQVTWPDRRATARMTYAVFVFSLVFTAIITVVDYGLDKVFRSVFL